MKIIMESWKRFTERLNEPKQLTAQAISDSKVPNQIDRAVELALSRIADPVKKKELAALFKQAHAFGHKLGYGKYKNGTYSLNISGFRIHPVTENEIRYVYFKQGSLSSQKSSEKLKVKPVTKPAADIVKKAILKKKKAAPVQKKAAPVQKKAAPVQKKEEPAKQSGANDIIKKVQSGKWTKGGKSFPKANPEVINLIYKLQGLIGAKQDGVFGKETAKAIQRKYYGK